MGRLPGRNRGDLLTEDQRFGESVEPSLFRQTLEVNSELDQVRDLRPSIGGEGLSAVEYTAAEQSSFHVVGQRHRVGAQVDDALNLLRLENPTDVADRQHVEYQQLRVQLNDGRRGAGKLTLQLLEKPFSSRVRLIDIVPFEVIQMRQRPDGFTRRQQRAIATQPRLDEPSADGLHRVGGRPTKRSDLNLGHHDLPLRAHCLWTSSNGDAYGIPAASACAISS